MVVNDTFLNEHLYDYDYNKDNVNQVNHEDYEHDSDKDYLIKKNEELKSKIELENLR